MTSRSRLISPVYPLTMALLMLSQVPDQFCDIVNDLVMRRASLEDVPDVEVLCFSPAYSADLLVGPQEAV